MLWWGKHPPLYSPPLFSPGSSSAGSSESTSRSELDRLASPDRADQYLVAQEVPYLTWIRATQRHLTPLQAATCPDSRARTVPSNLSEPCPLPRPLRSIIGASAELGALSSSTYERIAGFSISPAAWMKARP